MRIDKRLNLVVPIFGDEIPQLDGDKKPVLNDGRPVMIQPIVAYVHSVPLSEEVVDRYFMILGQTYSAIFSRGLGIVGGPAIALRLLRQMAMDQKVWDDDPREGIVGVQRGIVEEMRRLTNVVVPGDAGQPWRQIPLQIAVDQKIIDSEDRTEVENAIAFFIVASAVLNRSMRRPMLESAAELWTAQISSLNSTELANSLVTSTGTASSGEKSPAPAPPSAEPANAMVDGKPSLLPV